MVWSEGVWERIFSGDRFWREWGGRIKGKPLVAMV